MGKSKSAGLARLPREQRCHFLIGPVESWFMPNTTDIWTQPNRHQGSTSDALMDCDLFGGEDDSSISIFAYGSIGCFCYGEIYLGDKSTAVPSNKDDQTGPSTGNKISALVKRLIDIKDDNSRVSCIRFLKHSPHPIIIALTESGSLVIYDCLKSECSLQFKKTEILTNYLGLHNEKANFSEEKSAKRAKFGVTRQINSCTWPNTTNIFLGISMIKEKTCFLLWLKVNDVIATRTSGSSINKSTFVESFQKIELALEHYANPICLIDSTMLNETICLIAVGMDDGFITVVVLDLEKGQTKRIIKLARHNDQISSMSLNVDNQKKFPLGLLASVSRDGLMLIWDIENEFYFADYQALTESSNNRRPSSQINWFASTFVSLKNIKQLYVAVSNPQSGVTLLEVPENTRLKTRLKDNSYGPSMKKQQASEQTTLRHNSLIFNIEYDRMIESLITSSLDGNHIFWSLQKAQNSNNNSSITAKPEYLIPAMLNNSRTHMLRSSPIREDLLCLALGKAGVKFFKISDNVMDCKFDMSPSCSLVARKITKANVSPTSIAWHPNHEYRLAIGTLEGKVFRADITPRKASLIEAEYAPLVKAKRPVEGQASGPVIDVDEVFGVEYTPIFRSDDRQQSDCEGNQKSKHPKTDGIYSLCWGPNPASPQDVSKFAIYAVGSISHRLFIYYSAKDSSDKLMNYLDEFKDISLPEAVDQASEVAWKPSMDLMALGTQNGRILIVSYLDESHEGRSNNRLFVKIAVIEGPFKTIFIQCLAWHPTTDKDDAHYYYLAASSNESPAFVFNLKESILVAEVKAQLKLDQSRSEDQMLISGGDINGIGNVNSMAGITVLSAHVNKMDAHEKAITDIAWNPHEPDQLATSSFDRMCYVWSINNAFMEAKLLSKFSARDRLFTLEWSLVDSDLLFTSGHDSTVWAWRPSENHVKASD